MITVKALALVPRITTNLFSGFYGQALSIALKAAELPSTRPLPSGYSFTAEGLPSGFSINSATGLVSGTKLTTSFSFTAYARNEAGVGPKATVNIVLNNTDTKYPIIYGPEIVFGVFGTVQSFTVKADRVLDSSGIDDGTWFLVGYGNQISSSVGSVVTYTPGITGRVTGSISATAKVSVSVSNGWWGGSTINTNWYTSERYIPISIQAATGAPKLNIPVSASARQGQPFSLELKSSQLDCDVWMWHTSSGYPAGLTVTPQGGSNFLTGTPTAPGNYKISFIARQKTGSRLLSMPTDLILSVQSATAPVIPASPLQFPNPSLLKGDDILSFAPAPNLEISAQVSGTVGVDLDYTITASGLPTRFEVSELPPGLAVNENTGQVTGQPTQPGSYEVTVVPYADLVAGMPFGLEFIIAAAPGSPVVSSAATAAGQVGVAFSYQIAASEDPESYSTGSLPEFLILDAQTGLITGTPTHPGIYTIQLGASNAIGQGASLPLVVTIAAADGTPLITSAVSATTQAGETFSFALSAAPAASFYGATELPLGLSLDAETGVISGTATETGTFSPEVWAINASGEGNHSVLELTVSAAADIPEITGPAAPPFLVGTPFSVQLLATHSPTSFNSPPLPAWVSFDAYTGMLTGTAPAEGAYPLVFSANNANGTGPDFTVSLTSTDNLPPTFPGYAVSTPYETAATISLGKLLARASDPDGDALSITAAGPSANAGTVMLQATSILYTPATGFAGTDSFPVTITDARGASVIGTVTVTVQPNTGIGLNPPVITFLSGGRIGLDFQGIPGRSYQVQRSVNLTDWTTLTTVTASLTNGAVNFIDESPPQPNGYYRLRKP